MSKHKARQKLRIIEAAMHLIGAEGLSRINMSKIAAATGITRQTLYNYFPDIESIIAAMLEMHSNAAQNLLLEKIQLANEPKEKLHIFADFQISMTSPEHDLKSLEAGLSAEARTRLTQHEEQLMGTLEQVLASGIKSGVFSSTVDIKLLRDLIWGVIEGGMAASLRHPEQKKAILAATLQAMAAILSA